MASPITGLMVTLPEPGSLIEVPDDVRLTMAPRYLVSSSDSVSEFTILGAREGGRRAFRNTGQLGVPWSNVLSALVPPCSRVPLGIRYHKRDVIQQRMPFVTEQIEVKERRIVGVPVEEWSVDADGVVIEPAVLRVEVKSIEGTPNRR